MTVMSSKPAAAKSSGTSRGLWNVAEWPEAGGWWNVDLQPVRQVLADAVAQFRGCIEEEVVHEELIGVAIEGDEREQLVSALDEHVPAWTGEGAHVAKGCVSVVHVREDAERDERIEFRKGLKGDVRRGIFDIAEDDGVGIQPVLGHLRTALLDAVCGDLQAGDLEARAGEDGDRTAVADPDLEHALRPRLGEHGQDGLEGEVVGGVALPEVAEALVFVACIGLRATAVRIRHGVLHWHPFDMSLGYVRNTIHAIYSA